MATYRICFEQIVSDDRFEVEANSEEEALEIAEKKYNDCEFIVDCDGQGTLEKLSAAVVAKNGERIGNVHFVTLD